MTESDLIHKDQYYVAVKLFLEKGGKFFIFKDRWNSWDLPGGRIRKYEFDLPLEQVIERKMKEEVGDDVSYELGKSIVTMRHQREEQEPGDGTKPTIRIFAVGYEAKLIEGAPRLGDHHVEMLWADIKTFKPEEYFTGGWLKGVQDYLALKRL
jgi:8-oxo-dGTP pyrophosphatase MutT (NUDIX family)